MGSRDSRVDVYIAAAAGFAQPILARLRDAVHAGCPMVVETMQWGLPHFEYHGPLGSMAALPAHCEFVLARRGPTPGGDDLPLRRRLRRIVRLADLPDAATLAAKVRTAAASSRPSRRPDAALVRGA